MKHLTEQERMKQKPFPLPSFTKGTKVQVYMGAGWSTGYVTESQQTRCSVNLVQGNKPVTVFDARSIRRHNA